MRKSPSKNSDPDRRRIRLGADGEALAVTWYEARGWRVLQRNWRCRDGEIDLIVASDETLVFCEVKTRSSLRFGTPAEAVTRTKQLRIRKLARLYLATGEVGFVPVIRFDIASVNGSAVDVIEGAF